MYNLSTRMTGFMLVFGIFFTLSCSTLQSGSDNTETLYNNNNYNAALEAVDKEISENPDDSEKKVLKARILKDFAINGHDSSNREQLYSNLRNTVDDIQFSTDQFNTVTDSILNAAWLHEQSEGVRYLQQNGTENIDRHFDRVISHFSNAITIIPDSIVTYNLKATTYYRNGDLTKAIETLESISEKGFQRPPDTYEKLAYLYLEAGMIDRSIEVYEGLASNHPETEIYKQGLVNAYVLGEKHQQSIELLEDLVREYPNRAEYREALATERYYLLQNTVQAALLEADESRFSISEVEKYTQSFSEITAMYNDIDSALPASEERKQRIAEFHLNAAALFSEIASVTNSESDPNQLASAGVETHLREAIPYLSSLFESNTDNIAYARKLIEVYNNLEMEQEAEILERQINF